MRRGIAQEGPTGCVAIRSAVPVEAADSSPTRGRRSHERVRRPDPRARRVGHRRARLRRAAAGDGVRRGRASTSPASTSTRERVDAIARARAPTSSTCRPSATRAVDGRLRATTDYAACRELDALTICVPTPLVEDAHARPLLRRGGGRVGRRATCARASSWSCSRRPTRARPSEIVRPILERAGAVVGQDFFLGYAPERVDPATSSWTMHTTPKLVAGVTDECLRRTKLLYETDRRRRWSRSRARWWPRRRSCTRTPSARSTSRSPTSSRSCATGSASPRGRSSRPPPAKPFGFLPHYPGPGLGGDCIPVVPHFLAWRAARVRLLARS